MAGTDISEKHRDEPEVRRLIQLIGEALDGEAVLKHRLGFKAK